MNKIQKTNSRTGSILEFKNKSLVIEALQGKKIKDCSFDEIKQLLARVIVIIGLPVSSLPEKSVKMMVINYILTQMDYLTLEEFQTAFIMGVQKKLLVENERQRLVPVDMEHYNILSIKYIENVIQAYVAYRKPILRQIQQENKLLPEKPKWDVNDSINVHVHMYKKYLNGKEIYDAGGVIFKKLRNVGLINLSDSELSTLKIENNESNILDVFSKQNSDFNPNNTLQALKNFYNEMKEMNISDEDYKIMLKEKFQ